MTRFCSRSLHRGPEGTQLEAHAGRTRAPRFMRSYLMTTLAGLLPLSNDAGQLDRDATQVLCAHRFDPLEVELDSAMRCIVHVAGHVQVSQAPTRHEPGYAGEIDYRYIFGQLRALGYDGYIGAEYKPSVSTTASTIAWIDDMALDM